MSHRYVPVQWNAHKRRYDLIVVGVVAAFIGIFVAIGLLRYPAAEAPHPPILVMRALGVSAFVLLHMILAIGPLARLDDRFSPWLYNRRHLGVTTFLLGLLHAAVAIAFYGGFGDTNPLFAVLAGHADWTSLTGFPFEILGFVALLLLFCLAATSHDFWLANLGPSAWKWIHVSVYPAYGLLVAHVVLGALQSERFGLYPWMLAIGVGLVGSLHLAAAVTERRRRREARTRASNDGTAEWLDVGRLADIPHGGAVTVRPPSGCAIAIFRHDGGVHAVQNACAHQGGPLGEGRIIDGCITCPWHGYQYRPESGTSPPPYTERVPTYEVRVEGERVHVRTSPTTAPAAAPTPAPATTPDAEETDRD